MRAYGEQAGPDVARMAFLLDKKELKHFEVPAVHDNPKFIQMTIQGTAGKHEFGASYLNNYVNRNAPEQEAARRSEPCNRLPGNRCSPR